jgi:hypothetical protein
MTHDIIVNEAARWRNGARQVHGSGVVKSLELTGSGPVGVVHTQKFQFLKQKTHCQLFSGTGLAQSTTAFVLP